MGFGGPVWHASASSPDTCRRDTLRDFVLKALYGVGREEFQWEEDRTSETGVYHVRRRLTDAEAQITGPVKDIRGTQEADYRRQAMRRVVSPKAWRFFD
jgi:hypothetical protein